MRYTCENCKNRYTWDCEGRGGCGEDCYDFSLDLSTLCEKEQMLYRVLRQIMSEKD